MTLLRLNSLWPPFGDATALAAAVFPRWAYSVVLTSGAAIEGAYYSEVIE